MIDNDCRRCTVRESDLFLRRLSPVLWFQTDALRLDGTLFTCQRVQKYAEVLYVVCAMSNGDPPLASNQCNGTNCHQSTAPPAPV